MQDAGPWASLAEDGGGLEVHEFVTARVNAVAKALSRSAARLYLQQSGITVPEWRIIANLVLRQPCTATELLETVAMDKALVSRVIRQLTDRGLVKATASDSDRRRSLLKLTLAGQRIYQQLLPQARRRQAALISDLTLAERKILWVALRKLECTAERIARAEEAALHALVRPGGNAENEPGRGA